MTDDEHDEVILDADEIEAEFMKIAEERNATWLSVMYAAVQVAGVSTYHSGMTRDEAARHADLAAEYIKKTYIELEASKYGGRQ